MVGEEDERDGDRHVLGGAAATRAAPVVQTTTALPPGEAGLHYGRNDTMRGMDARTTRPDRTVDGSGPYPVTRRMTARRFRGPRAGASRRCSTTSRGGASSTPRRPACRSGWPPGGGSAPTSGSTPPRTRCTSGTSIPIFGLLRLQQHGGRPVALVGGGTGMIGDPSGRSSERNLLDVPTLERNVAAIGAQLERFLDFSPGPAQAVHGQQPRLAGHDLADRLPARRRQALHRALHARQGLRPGAARARAVVHRVQLHDAPGASTSRPSTGSTASRCRWAARTSGGTSPPASS